MKWFNLGSYTRIYLQKMLLGQCSSLLIQLSLDKVQKLFQLSVKQTIIKDKATFSRNMMKARYRIFKKTIFGWSCLKLAPNCVSVLQTPPLHVFIPDACPWSQSSTSFTITLKYLSFTSLTSLSNSGSRQTTKQMYKQTQSIWKPCVYV